MIFGGKHRSCREGISCGRRKPTNFAHSRQEAKGIEENGSEDIGEDYWPHYRSFVEGSAVGRKVDGINTPTIQRSVQ